MPYNITMSELVRVPDFTPSKKQSQFLASPAYETFYGGAAGGGKSAALVAEAVTSCLEDPGHRTYIFRRTIPEIRQSIVPEIKKQCAAYLTHMPYSANERTFKFDNGSELQLAYLDDPGDMYRYQSAEIHTLLIDEATHFSKDEYDYLKTRVRSMGKRRLRIMLTSNPGNIGHGWVKSYFMDVIPPNTVYQDPVTGLTRQFIPAKIDDHPDKDFRERYKHDVLDAIADPRLKSALRDGDWSVFQGQFYPEFDYTKHVYHDSPVDINDCHRYIGLDWGYNDFTAIYWIAETPELEDGKHYYVYREMYGNQIRPEAWAETIADVLARETVDFLAMPHDTFSNLGGTRPIVDQFRAVFERRKIKVRLIRAPGGTTADMIGRQTLLHELLAETYMKRPKLQFHESCLNLIRTLPMLAADDKRPEKIADHQEDHAENALGYCLYAIPRNHGNAEIISPKGYLGDIKKGYLVEDGRITHDIDISKLLKATTKVGEGNNKSWLYR